MTDLTTTRDRIEGALTNHEADNPDYPGLTVKDLSRFLGKSETTVRDNLKTLVAEGRVTKEGSTYKMTDTTSTEDEIESTSKPPTKSQAEMTVRQDAVMTMLERNPKGLSVEELAIKMSADDYDDDRGWSPRTYAALRRLRDEGKVERVIAWRVVD